MEIYPLATLSINDAEIQKFVFDKQASSLKVNTPEKPGYSLVETRESKDKPKEEDVIFQVEETWAIEKDSAPTGYNKLTVIYSQTIALDVVFHLLFKDGEPEAAKQHAITLLNQYDPLVHGADIEGWVTANLGDELKEDMFVLDTELVIEKRGEWHIVNCDQLAAFWQLHGNNFSNPAPHDHACWGGGSDAGGDLNIIGDYNIHQWSDDLGITVRFISRKLLMEWEPTAGDFIHELTPPDSVNDIQTVESIIDNTADLLVPSDCGAMKHKKHRVATIYNWPEFKIEWRSKRIKIGCATVTIVYPILRTRTAKMACYVFYSVPVNTAQTALKVAETCAIRSALSAGVVGVITANPALAQAAFNELFRRCVMKEIIKCINPGLMTIKEVTGWS